MEAFLVTIIAGVIVVIIGLIIEYGVFQKLRQNQDKNLLPENDVPPQLSDNPFAKLLSSLEGDQYVLSWPDAINKAVGNFGNLHPKENVTVTYVNVGQGDTANITVKTRKGEFALTLNRTGEILTIHNL